ncbi:MAG: hypothetical protein WC455_12625 [Dehalococcoidia bacterium]|jgi:hypothetical protein
MSNPLPDCVFASSNTDGIADLMPDMQGDFLDYPLVYGSVKRDGDYRGKTIWFETDDSRFNALGNAVLYGDVYWKLWERPDRVWKSGAPSFVEVNFSTSNAQPRWRALEQIGKKRHLSRYWQERGMRCWVDLNVAPRWWEENLLGVPLGWNAYATRVHKNDSLQTITDQASLAESHAGTDKIKFAVWGHRKEIEALCQRQGWIYVSEQKEIWSKRDASKAIKKESLHLEKQIMIEDIKPRKITGTLEDWIHA